MELKPCPFCGDKEVSMCLTFEKDEIEIIARINIVCHACDNFLHFASLSEHEDMLPTILDVTERWNKRS